MKIIYIPNTRAEKLYNIRAIKTDACDERIRLKGAVFDLYKFDERCGAYFIVEKNLCTDKNGESLIKNLPAGRYKFVEICAPCGYFICHETILRVEVNSCQADCENTVEITISNRREKCCRSCSCIESKS